MIIFGTRLFGKVDEVPGLFHVATKFGHVNFVPLIPLEGWLVFGQEGNGWRGITIPMSMKSVAVAWIRFVLVVGGLLGLLFGFIGMNSMESGGGLLLTAGVLSLAAFIGSYFWKWLSRADAERALELATLAGIPEEGLDQIRVSFGLPVAARARAGWPPEGEAR
jgi:hypothetical protein